MIVATSFFWNMHDHIALSHRVPLLCHKTRNGYWSAQRIAAYGHLRLVSLSKLKIAYSNTINTRNCTLYLEQVHERTEFCLQVLNM